MSRLDLPARVASAKAVSTGGDVALDAVSPVAAAADTPDGMVAPPGGAGDAVAPLLLIQEVAAETGLTPRTIRYYEELGLLAPAARSGGAYRLYDADDLDRLRFIRGLRDDAGFSLAEIRQLLEDEQARARNREQFRATQDPAERRVLLGEALDRTNRQWATLHGKIARMELMLADVDRRRARLAARLADLDSDPEADGNGVLLAGLGADPASPRLPGPPVPGDPGDRAEEAR